MPNYGELKTAFFTGLGPARLDLSTFEFGENFDAAQRFFATVLPG